MSRVLSYYVSVETAALGAFEFGLSFIIIETMLGGLSSLGLPPAPLATAGFAVAMSFGIIVMAAMFGLYRPEVCLDERRAVREVLLAAAAAAPVMAVTGTYLGIPLTPKSMVWLGTSIALWLAAILVAHFTFAALMRSQPLARRVLVLGSGPGANRLAEIMRKRHGLLFEPVITADQAANFAPAELRSQRVWGIVVASGGTPETCAKLLDRKLRGLRVFDCRGFCERHLGRIDPDAIDASWLLFADGFSVSRVSAFAKRALDIASSLVLLVLTLPLMAVVAALIKLDSPGPVFYRQERVGLHGQPFTLLKFRSMRTDAEAGGRPRWAQQRDPRITRVGSFIRPMRIDELPQLLNVLRGEMSMVGPRPERPHFVEQLAQVLPFYAERSYVKPGITGWAQINYPYGASVEDAREKLAYDLYYVKHRGVLLDLMILVSTIRVILFREGAR